jgi:myo-inositol-1-phosphate synthase
MIYFGNDLVTAKTTLKNPTHIYKLSKFWLKHPDVQPGDKIRLTIIKKFEEYRIDVI